MAKKAAKTGAGPTALVVVEQYFPKEQRIVDDNLASRLVLPSGMGFLLPLLKIDAMRNLIVSITDKSIPGLWGCMMCRKRYIDEKLIGTKNKIDAVVNFGAGFDTRAYRLPALKDMPVWEIDQFENIHTKEMRLRKVFGTIPFHVKLIAMDFDRENLDTVLTSHGYTIGKSTFFIWEAVTQYLTESAVLATFDFLSKAARGSQLTFTYVRRDFIDGKTMYGWDKFYRTFVVKDKVWLFGMNPNEWPDFLKKYGWRIIEDVGYDELADKYVKPTGRVLASTPVERMVYAEKL